MRVVIKDQEYEFSFNSIWGPLYTYEVIAGKHMPFNPQQTLCLHILYYCILLRSNPGITLSFDDFILSLNDVKLVNILSDYYTKRMDVLTEGVEDDSEKKKRKLSSRRRKKAECP